MSSGKKLIKDTFIYGTANGLSAMLAFFMLPVYTRYFTPSEYGVWDVTLTTVTLLAPFITFELVAAVYRWLILEDRKEKRVQTITTGVITVTRNLLLFNGVALLILFFTTIPHATLAIILINVTVISSFLQQTIRGLKRNVLFASLGVIRSIVMIGFILVLMFIFHLRVEAFFYASIIADVTVIVCGWVKINFGSYINFSTYSRRQLKSLLTYALPLIPSAISWWAMTMSDRYFILGFLTVDTNGIYAIATKIPAVLLTISSVFFLAWKDNAIIAYQTAEKNAYYSNVFKPFFRLMMTSVFCLIIFTKPVLQIAIDADYFSAWRYIPILLIATMFHAFALFWSAGYHGAKKTNVILVTTIVGSVVNALLNFLFIKTLGLYAVVGATAIAFFITWLMRISFARKYFHIKLPITDFFVLFVLLVIVGGVTYLANEVILLISGALAILFFLYYNRTLITQAVSTIYGLYKNTKTTHKNE